MDEIIIVRLINIIKNSIDFEKEYTENRIADHICKYYKGEHFIKVWCIFWKELYKYNKCDEKILKIYTNCMWSIIKYNIEDRFVISKIMENDLEFYLNYIDIFCDLLEKKDG